MKRTWITVLSTLLLVLALSYGISFLMPLFNSPRVYSDTNCLTDQITADMDIYDIGNHYIEGNATVAVNVSYGGNAALGSGVCIASKGYKTGIDTEEGKLGATKGSYIVTNHHVIDMGTDNYSSLDVTILTEQEERFKCNVLWANENLDIAVLYSDTCNLNYVTMKDIVIDPDEGERFKIQQIFTIGCPLDEQDYLNRFTEGNIATNDVLSMMTVEYVSGKEVLSNMYEDVVDMTVGITPGNSGGGCFDKDGYLIGLSTLSTDETTTGGNQMNGFVPIYPAMCIIDKLIENNEADGANTIYTLDKIGISGIDSIEASIAKDILIYKVGTYYYYLNGKTYSRDVSRYATGFNMTQEGYYILDNTGLSSFRTLSTGGTITSCIDASGKVYEIKDRNDFIYFLLNISNGDSVTINVGARAVKITV
ncbi:MAG: trypsin-like peptidase domain-containing protein [Clostridia bacterium]|nr:trypsin-like peptidase domain-containing protein [Clostridia bacterium]